MCSCVNANLQANVIFNFTKSYDFHYVVKAMELHCRLYLHGHVSWKTVTIPGICHGGVGIEKGVECCPHTTEELPDIPAMRYWELDVATKLAQASLEILMMDFCRKTWKWCWQFVCVTLRTAFLHRHHRRRRQTGMWHT